MSTFSLVGAVVPVAAAGSLFAGFMSVTNLGYTFSYASGAWLYDARHVAWRRCGPCSTRCSASAAGPADKLSMNMLILIGSLAYFASFLAVHLLPGREATLAADGDAAAPRARNAGSPCRPGCGGRRTGARWRSARRCSPGWRCA